MKAEKTNSQTLVDFAETILDENHLLRIRMHGFSMYPFLKAGDVGIVDKCLADQLRIGDIVVFKSQQKLIAHRLIAIKDENKQTLYVAKGDKNKFVDATFPAEALFGKIISIERNGKLIEIDSKSMKLKSLLVLKFPKQVIRFHNSNLRIKNLFSTAKLQIKSLRKSLAIVSQGSMKLFWINAVIAVLQGIVPFVIIVLIKLLVDYLTNVAGNNTAEQWYYIALLVVTALVFFSNGLLTEIRSFFSEKLSQSITRHIYGQLHAKHAELELSNYENPDRQDQIHRAVQEASFRPVKIINALLTAIKSVASVLFLVGLFMTIRWYLVFVLLLATFPDVFLRIYFAKRRYKLKDAQNPLERKMYYFNRILTGFPFAKELKLFGFNFYFLKQFFGLQDRLFAEKSALTKSEIRWNVLSQLYAVVLIFSTLAFISILNMKGDISIGTVVLFFFAFQRSYSVLNDFFRSFTQIIEDNTFLKDFIEFLELPSTITNGKEGSEFSLNSGIRFENVNFSYETSKRKVLENINLTIPAGKKVAFVGANGSGKTTLIKLLCGFYQPQSGHIFYDKTDSADLGQDKICKHITAVFQDFALYNVSALQNIGLGNIASELDLNKAKKAAQDAGVDTLLENLPNGYQTLLGNLFRNAEELSIGQWQKIAIARAFYRDTELLLMDEPSSALDASSEVQIIDSLKKLSHNKTAVIISHRLSSVQWADLIYLLDQGRIIESGSHQELLDLKGKYYQLFNTNGTFEE